MLILFDIDMTLLKTNGAGRRAMQTAGGALFGRAFTIDGLDFSGRLDPLILTDLLTLNGVEPTPSALGEIKHAYIDAFAAEAEGAIEPLDGAVDLARAIIGHPDATAGVLTGNFAETGAHKLRAIGLDPEDFPVRVWGDDSPHDPPARDHLPPVGVARYRDLHGDDPRETVILGDTVHDVRCGLTNGCRVLAVATGRTDAASLADAGAHRVVGSLADTDDLEAWLLGR